MRKLCPTASVLKLGATPVQPSCPQAVRLVGWKHKGFSPHEAGVLCQTKAIKLVPEPDNAHDANAIKVVCGKVHVGYVSRETQNIAKKHRRCTWKFGGYNPNATVIFLKPVLV